MNEDSGPLTVYAVRPSGHAADQIEAEHQRLQQRSGLDTADAWEDALMDAIASLATLPERCRVAPENDLFQRVRPGQTLRVLLDKQTRSSAAWRILFSISSPNGSDPPTVEVLRVLHGSQAPMDRWIMEEGDYAHE